MFNRSPQEDLYFITLLRHGQSVGNAQGYYQGQSEFDLTPKGRAQAEALAGRWQAEGVRFNLAIASPLGRARQTAEIIARSLDLELESDPLWMERNNGRMAGLHRDEIAERLNSPDFVHPFLSIGETGESQWELYIRAGQAVQKLLHRPPGRYLVVSHGGLLNMALYVALGIAPQANFSGPRFRFRNTAFANLVYDPGIHVWKVETINDHNHLKQSD